MKLVDFFARRPVFTSEEFTSFLDADGLRSPRTREALLAHHVRTGRIYRVRRGLYVSVPFGFTSDTYPVDPFVLAGKMSSDAVLAYHTALQFFGKAHSVREDMIFLTSQAIRPMTFRGYEYRGVAFPKPLVDKKQELFGVNMVERTGIAIKVTSLERSLVDLLDRPVLGGGWEEIWRSLEAVEFFDIDKVTDYAKLLGNSTTAAKVGFYLEQHRKELMVEDKHLSRLQEYCPKQPTYMSRNVSGRLVKRWNLVVSDQILDRSWEETY